MQKLLIALISSLSLLCIKLDAQVKTNFNNQTKVDVQGKFVKSYKIKTDFEIAAKDISTLLKEEKKKTNSTHEAQSFQIAVPISINLNIAKLINWSKENDSAYGKFTIKVNGALSSSINFDSFYLPKGTEMYIYNEGGNMITGPITESENNSNKIYGSWVYRGSFLIIEIKTPTTTLSQLLLHANNIAYGYKEIYQVGGFGQSAPCEINVLCPLGNGWQNERNSVALGISGDGTNTFSGSIIMNACANNRPFFLTANHVYEEASPAMNVTGWRFTFQAWSPTCAPSQNSNGVTFNGSTLRANWANSDFCLVELNNVPPGNSGVNYAGWNRNTTGITQTTIIHHPAGDVMKITNDVNPPAFGNFLGAQCWHLIVDNGTTEGGSSGAPYFDQNHRIIGQHYGIDDGNLPICNEVSKYGGRFDLSWSGGGTSATRLSDWLDPGNTGAMTTNTTNVSALPNVVNLVVTGSPIVCNAPQSYSINTTLPVVWSASPGNTVTLSCTNCNSTTLTRIASATVLVTLTATLPPCGSAPSLTASTNVGVGLGNYSLQGTYSYGLTGPMPITNFGNPTTLFGKNNTNYNVNVTLNNNYSGSTNYAWSVAGGNAYSQVQFSGSNASFYLQGSGSPTISLNYTATNSNCGSITRNIVAIASLGNSAIINNISVSPNPSTGAVTVSLSSSQQNRELAKTKVSNNKIYGIKIVGMEGTILKTYSYPSGQAIVNIDVSTLKNGTYILQVFDNLSWASRQIIILK